MVNAGKYRYPAKLLSVPVGNDFGGKDQDPVEIGTLWVHIKPLSGSEPNSGDQIQELNQYEIRTPWTPLAIHSRMRIKTDVAEYEISHVDNVEEENQQYRLRVTRLTNAEDT